MGSRLSRLAFSLSPIAVAMGCLTDERVILETPDASADAGENAGGEGGAPGLAGAGGDGWAEFDAGESFGGSSSGGTGGRPDTSGTPAAGRGGGGRGGTGGKAAPGGGAGDGGEATGGQAGSGEGLEPMCPDLDQDGIVDCEQTLAKNPSFVLNNDDWSVDSTVEYTWHPEGAASARDQGSVTVTSSLHLPVSDLSMAGLYQCVPAEGERTYGVFVHVLVPEEQEGAGSGAANMLFYPTEDCSGAHVGAFSTAHVPKGKRWSMTAGLATAPKGVKSLSVRLVAVKSYLVPAFSVRFDDVLIRAL